ncbi:ribosomal protein S13 (mitochondrion) [Monosiga brevicollis]|uniref:Ribosomal protein S13 n=1 Tax=Monosiga brevicollis TaxID=81824 RepID=Q8HIT6_MONBE|nr:ribosomal protein S13 [Monosiga brevicollis]AAN28348.1 ribosomal protein S13 [Monosiga brevicollis]|eukprot:NP_696977.1 ribosomal protein S13 (mitochondrion) [Monosiga brevicollis ATCC 50154]
MYETRFKKNLSLYRNLLKIKGLGKFKIFNICQILGINPNIEYSKLSEHYIDELNLLLANIKKQDYNSILENVNIDNTNTRINNKNIDKNKLNLYLFNKNSTFNKSTKNIVLIEENLNDYESSQINTLIQINALRGRRIKMGYPSKGQRTRSNAITAKRINKRLIKK